jgi:Pyruvate/2-oxoacid:ferredoxin oxidoreductase gamma subunit
MHDKFWGPVGRKLRDGALVLVNDATFGTELDESRYRVLRVPATDTADALGNPLGGSLVMAGAYAAISGLVGLDALIEGMRESIPPYRTQHIAANETAIAAGHEWGSDRKVVMA